MSSSIYGTSGNDLIKQDPSSFPKPGELTPVIYSLEGDDYVIAYRAAIEGGPGNNIYEGGKNDPQDYPILSYRESFKQGVIIDFVKGIANNPFGGIDTLKGYFPQVWGSSTNDLIILDDKEHGIVSMGGQDTVIGGSSLSSFLYVTSIEEWEITRSEGLNALIKSKKTGESVTTTNIIAIKEFTGKSLSIFNYYDIHPKTE